MKFFDKLVLTTACAWLVLTVARGTQLDLFDITYLFIMVMAYYGVDAINAALLRQIIFIATSILRNADETYKL